MLSVAGSRLKAPMSKGDIRPRFVISVRCDMDARLAAAVTSRRDTPGHRYCVYIPNPRDAPNAYAFVRAGTSPWSFCPFVLGCDSSAIDLPFPCQSVVCVSTMRPFIMGIGASVDFAPSRMKKSGLEDDRIFSFFLLAAEGKRCSSFGFTSATHHSPPSETSPTLLSPEITTSLGFNS